MSKAVLIYPLRLVAGIPDPSMCLVILILGTVFHFELEAQEPPRDGPVRIDLAARNGQPAFLVRADVNHATRDYRQGDALSVRVACEVDAYLYVLYQQADGQVFQIYPNAHQADNRATARQTVEIPDKDDEFRWSIGPPFGDEVIKVIAAKRPIRGLADGALRQKQFNAVSVQQVKGIALELGAEPPNQWTEHDVKIHTYPRGQERAAPNARRFGVFVGVSDYKFNAQYERVFEGRKRLNLEGCNRDARATADVLREVGQLSDLRVYTNEQATRETIESAVTRWLPAVSRPGDTLIFFYAGHGMQIPADNPYEADGKDEVLAPYDTVTYDVLLKLVEERDRKELDPALRADVQHWQQIAATARERGDTRAQITGVLVRETGISDDLFGHWLQGLDGRRIIIVLDSCNSGGLLTPEKGDDEVPEIAPVAFDFLDREVSRLKDIGQGEIALLAACSAGETSITRLERDHGVLTFSLLQVLRETRGPVDIRQAYAACRTSMHRYFETTNVRLKAAKQKPLSEYEPVFTTFTNQPLFLKP
jgi:hypothetical protein